MEESKEYTLKKEKLEKKLTKAYQINDVRKIVELKQKLIKLCSSYAATQYKKYSIEYQFVEVNGVMRLKADVQETTSPKLSTEQVVEIITHNKKRLSTMTTTFTNTGGKAALSTMIMAMIRIIVYFKIFDLLEEYAKA